MDPSSLNHRDEALILSFPFFIKYFSTHDFLWDSDDKVYKVNYKAKYKVKYEVTYKAKCKAKYKANGMKNKGSYLSHFDQFDHF